MTPLAHAITKELLLPPSKRTFRDQSGLLGRMDDIHCFECTAVVDLASEMSTFVRDHLPDETDSERNLRATDRFAKMAAQTSFLPTPKTWLEWKIKDGIRVGQLLIERQGAAEMLTAFARGKTWGSDTDVVSLTLGAGDPRAIKVSAGLDDSETQAAADDAVFVHILLALINTPRVIGRQQHAPHRGLERALLAGRKAIGVFPLHTWTEIKLEVNRPPEDLSADPSTEAHLTGQKALHFCRAHLRLRKGCVEIVRSHWRGDASLGIKRGRYTVVPPGAV